MICIFLLLASVIPSQAERRLTRPPGTTRYAAMVTRLKNLLHYDQTQGNQRMALSSIGQSVKGRTLWMVTLSAGKDLPAPSSAPDDSQEAAPDSGDTSAASQTAMDVPKRLLYICRQHGHEPASTEGALAFITKLVKAPQGSPFADDLTHVTVSIIPMANPDGAEAFVRHNAHDVDLNRDWLKQTQPETKALVSTIARLHPDLMTDQHELFPDDSRPDFTETVGPASGADPTMIAECDDAQRTISGAMRAEGTPSVSHLIDDHHPARLAHRYGCLVAGVPTLLFETNRYQGQGRSVGSRAEAHERFMTVTLRDLAGEQSQLLAEASAWWQAHDRNVAMLASRHKSILRSAPPLPVKPATGPAE